MIYSIRIRPEAVDDAEEIASYIGDRSFEGMLSWLDAYESARERLKQNPYQCGLAAEDQILKLGLRQITFRTRSGNRYRAVYVIDGDQVSILRVRGPGQPDLTEDDVPNS